MSIIFKGKEAACPSPISPAVETLERKNPVRPRKPYPDIVSIHFACPFARHESRKRGGSGDRKWHSCTEAPGWRTIPHLKEHLYESHVISQCPRCMTEFSTNDEFNSHRIGCFEPIQPKFRPIESRSMPEGITESMKEQLKRNTRGRGMSEQQRWGEIYNIIFPDEAIPSPWFGDGAEDILTAQYGALTLGEYDSFLRRELPLAFRSSIEANLNMSSILVENYLGTNLETLLRNCQEQVSKRYLTDVLARGSAAPSASHDSDADKIDNFDSNSIFDQLPPDVQILVPRAQTPVDSKEKQPPEWAGEVVENIQDEIYPRCDTSQTTSYKQAQDEGLTEEENLKQGAKVKQEDQNEMRILNSSVEKAIIIDRVMGNFWSTIFNKDWLITSRSHGTSSTTRSKGSSTSKSSHTAKCSTSSKNPTALQSNDKNVFGKRGRSTASEDEEDDDEKSKKMRTDQIDDDHAGPGFSCPYRKYNPAKYNVRDWAPCALTARSTIARIKTHLYKYHSIHQCQRCNDIFDDEQHLNGHVNAVEACPFVESLPGGKNGINRALKDLIRPRARLFHGQTEKQRWEHIYGLIFPGEPMPSPYWESPELSDQLSIERYDEYLIRELPTAVRRALLENDNHNDVNPSEDRIRDEAIRVLPGVLSMLSHTYRSTFDPNPSRDELLHGTTSARTVDTTIDPRVLRATPYTTNPEPYPTIARSRSLQIRQSVPAALPFSSDSAYFSGESNSGASSSSIIAQEDNNNTDAIAGNRYHDQQSSHQIQVASTHERPSASYFTPLISDQTAPGIPASLQMEDENRALVEIGHTTSSQNHIPISSDYDPSSNEIPLHNESLGNNAPNIDWSSIDFSSVDWDYLMHL